MDTEFGFISTEEVGVHGLVEETKTGRKGSHRHRKPKLEPTEKGGGKAKKAETWTWADVIKGLKWESSWRKLTLMRKKMNKRQPIRLRVVVNRMHLIQSKCSSQRS